MKNIKQLFFFFILLQYQPIFAQSGTWVWMKGSNSPGAIGSFGIKGVSSPTNEPHSRYQTAYWKDLKGNFWIFGGVDAANDLWKYNPIINEWTWIRGNTTTPIYGTKGIPSSLNNPPRLGYGANCWTDSLGDLWLFAGYNLSGGAQNDILWRYHIATDEWTWMKGDYTLSYPANYGTKGVASVSNTPGSRSECKSAWTYEHKLWLFGGLATSSGYKNDLWFYDIATNDWTWESGTNLVGDLGSYGTKGVPSSTNIPPSRLSYTRWQDNKNNFYIFAGARTTCLNDLWQYNPHTKLWTWISGTNLLNDTGTNNPYCLPDTKNIPRSRIENQTAASNNSCINAFWTFGGFDLTATTTFNDLWVFNITNYEWTKVKGTFGTPPSFSYGTKGVPNPSNLLPGRGGPAVWTDNTGTLYVFGGLIRTPSSGFKYLNDLWKFIPDTACFHAGLVGGIKLSRPVDTLICNGDTVNMPIPLNCTIDVKPATGVFINYATGKIQFFNPAGTRYTVIGTSKDPKESCINNDTVSFTITEYLNPMADFSSSSAKAYIDNPNFSFLNLSTNAVRYEWYYKGSLISTSKDIVYHFPSIGRHCLTLVAINQCEQRDSITKCYFVLDTTKLKSIPNATLCAGDTLNINIPEGVSFDISPDSNYYIDSTIFIIKFFPNKTTEYIISTKASNPNDTSFVSETFHITINVNEAPKAMFAIDPLFAFISNPNFSFINRSVNAISYEWYYAGKLVSTEKDITKSFPDTGKYCLTLVITNICNRKDTTSQCCIVYLKGKLLVPNIFTPNGDGINDEFKAILTSPYRSFNMMIMNRWGQEVFRSDSPYKGWDGKFNGQEEETGVYYYLITVKYDSPGAEDELLKGDVSLIR